MLTLPHILFLQLSIIMLLFQGELLLLMYFCFMLFIQNQLESKAKWLVNFSAVRCGLYWYLSPWKYEIVKEFWQWKVTQWISGYVLYEFGQMSFANSHVFSEVVVHFSHCEEMASSIVQLLQWVGGGRYSHVLVVLRLNSLQSSHNLCGQLYLMSIYSLN